MSSYREEIASRKYNVENMSPLIAALHAFSHTLQFRVPYNYTNITTVFKNHKHLIVIIMFTHHTEKRLKFQSSKLPLKV